MTATLPWTLMSNAALRAQLVHCGATEEQAEWMVEHRDDDPGCMAVIAETLKGRSE